MEELKETGSNKWVDFLLLIVLIFAAMALVIWAHSTVHGYVMAKCPHDTFLSGESRADLENLATSAVGAGLAFGIFALIA